MKSLLALAASVAILAGCGGGSSSSSGTFNIFTGTWTGPWSAGNDAGTATFHITGPGSVSGQIVDTTTNQTYQVSGQIKNPSLNSTTVNLTESNSGNTVDFTGTIVETGVLKSLNINLTATNASGATQQITLAYTGS